MTAEPHQKQLTEDNNASKKASKSPRPFPRKLFWLAGLAVVAVIAVGAFGHWRTNSAAKQTQEDISNEVPSVRTAVAKELSDPIKVTLPGQTQGFDYASIFARATGYVAERRVDIGSPVKKGDLLAKIASPDLDRQLDQAEAQLLQMNAALAQAKAQVNLAQANLILGNVTYARIGSLAEKGWETIQNRDNQAANVSSQQANVDAANAGVKVAEANVTAQEATVNRLKTLASFEAVTAPFDGVVSSRNIDVGDLVNADTGGGTPMFGIVKDDVLRVDVNVPQAQAVGIRDGLQAKVRVFELPDRTFSGRVARNAGALQSASRTLLIQVDVRNDDHALKAGVFVNVELDVPRQHSNTQVPAESLIFNRDGLHVATVTNGTISLKSVNVYRDLGETVELDSGLDRDVQVVLNPPTNIHDGQKVKVAQPSNGKANKQVAAEEDNGRP
jgi:HlyD family secretion protein